MTDNIEFDPTKAAKGGLAGIEGFRGILVSHARIPNKFGETRKKFGTEIDEVAPDQIEVSYEDVEITKMAEGEDEPELTDSKYTILINYAKPGAPKSNAQSQWNYGYTDSCQKVHGKLPNEMVGEFVQMVKANLPMKIRSKENKEGEEITVKRWTFVPVGDAKTEASEKATAVLLGLNKGAALRAIATNPTLWRDPDLKVAVLAGKPIAGLVLKDGVYQPEDDADATT